MRRPWEPAFVAVSTLLGEPPEAIAAALGDGERAAPPPADAAASRRARAEAIAAGVSSVIRALEAMGPS